MSQEDNRLVDTVADIDSRFIEEAYPYDREAIRKAEEKVSRSSRRKYMFGMVFLTAILLIVFVVLLISGVIRLSGKNSVQGDNYTTVLDSDDNAGEDDSVEYTEEGKETEKSDQKGE